MALSPPSSRRTSEVLPPLTTSQLAPGSLRAIGDYPYPVIGTATTDSSKGSHGKVPMFPPLDKGFSIRAVNTPNQSGENQSFTRAKRGFSVSTQSQSPMFSPPVGGPPLHIANQLSQFDGSHSSKEVPQGWGVSTQSQSSVMPQSTTPSHKPSKTYWQNSSQMPSHTPSQTQPQTPPPERISDPFDLELAKIFPEGRFKFSNTPNSENSQLKRLTTQSRRPSTSAGSSVAGRSTQSRHPSQSAGSSVVGPSTQSRHPSRSAGSSIAGPSTQSRYPSHSAGSSVAGQSVNVPDVPFVTPCPKTTPTRRIGNRIDVDYHAGLQLHFNTKLLPKAQVYSFSVMANSLSAISRLLFNPFAKEAIADWEMDETKRVTECVIIMYGNIEEQIIKKDEALKKVTPYLPELKTCEKVDELYMGVTIWSEILA